MINSSCTFNFDKIQKLTLFFPLIYLNLESYSFQLNLRQQMLDVVFVKLRYEYCNLMQFTGCISTYHDKWHKPWNDRPLILLFNYMWLKYKDIRTRRKEVSRETYMGGRSALSDLQLYYKAISVHYSCQAI